MKSAVWLGLLVLAVAAGWWFGAGLQQPPGAQQRLPPVTSCDWAQGACRYRMPDGAELVLGVDPAPPRVMVPLHLTVRLDEPVTAIWVNFAGLNMDMGFNRAELAPAGKGLWQGQVVLPVCSATEMRWEAQVYVTTGDKVRVVPFHFSTRPGSTPLH